MKNAIIENLIDFYIVRSLINSEDILEFYDEVKIYLTPSEIREYWNDQKKLKNNY